MKVKKYEDLNFGLLILGVGLFYFVMTMQIEIKNATINARTVPMLLCYMLGILGTFQTVKGIKKIKELPSQQKKIEEGIDIKTVAKAGGAIVMYIFLFEFIGFMITTAFFLFYMFYLLSPDYKKPNLLSYVVVSVSVSVGVYVLFKYGLDIMLPEGLIGGF